MLVDTAAVEWETLFVTHIFDGEEVVRGSKDGQTFVATFGDSRSAQRYVDAAKAGHLGAIYGFRRAELETKTEQVKSECAHCDHSYIDHIDDGMPGECIIMGCLCDEYTETALNTSPALPVVSEIRICEFCGCRTNARLRRCCDKGSESDASRPRDNQ